MGRDEGRSFSSWAAGLLVSAFGFLTLLSIGILLLPVGIAMIVAASFWDRPPLLAGITLGAVVLSAAYAMTAPWGCLQTSRPDGPTAVTTSCSRIALPDLNRLPTSGDYVLALGIAAVAAAAVGIGSAALVGRLERGRRESIRRNAS